MVDALDAVATAAKALVTALQQLWLMAEFKLDRDSTWRPRMVSTTGGAAARRLPTTGHFIRGAVGTEVDLSGGDFVYGEASVHNAVLRTLLKAKDERKSEATTDLDHAFDAVRSASLRLLDALKAAPHLYALLRDSLGWKTYSHEELIQRAVTENSDERVDSFIFLSELLDDSFGRAGFGKWVDREQFSAWDVVGEHLVHTLRELVTRNEHMYEAVAYLNAPLVDSDTAFDLGPLPDDLAGRITIGRATDADLSVAIEESGLSGLPLGVARANSVLRFPLPVSVGALVEEYESLYPAAERIVAGIIDVLRLVCLGDFGASALRIVAVSKFAPTLRRTYAWDYEPDNSPYIPRRQAYTRPGETLFCEQDAEAVRHLVPLRFAAAQPKGLEVALQRFRDSCERFPPDDPAKLLDMSIAFEALLLNDGVDKELRYRLRLRGARWLDVDFKTRVATFRLLGLLYDVRSKIAHGETLDSLDAGERKSIEEVLRDTPILLRRALRTTLEGGGSPVGNRATLREWWQKIELG